MNHGKFAGPQLVILLAASIILSSCVKREAEVAKPDRASEDLAASVASQAPVPSLPAATAGSPQPAAKPFSTEAERGAFEAALLLGDPSKASGADQAGAIESWANALSEAKGLDAAISRLEAASDKPGAPPQVAFALAALYGRKGLIQKQYAALEKSERASKARPDIVFALAAVYGRKDTLKSKYGADELLVGSLRAESDPSGAKILLDDRDRGVTPLTLERLKDGTHRLRLESEGYDSWETPFAVDTGQETKVAAKLVAKPKNGKLTLLSEPAGMQVVVDSDKTYATPASIELPAGEHSIEPKETSIGNAYYAAQPLQRITLPSGGEIKVPIKLTQETATLVIKLAPPGYKVIVNDQGKGETPVSKLVVAAGKNLIRFEAQGKPTRSFTVNPYPGKTVVVAWGITKETAVRLTRKTILLDGKTDSWDGIEPIDDESGFNFLGEEQYGIKSLYLCRDDAYLYWRIDFNAANPLYSKPKKTPDKNVVALQLAFGYKVECQLNLWVASNAGGNTLGDPYLGEYLKTRDGFDLASGKIMRGSNIGKSGDLAYLSSKSMIVGRVKYSQVSPKYLAGIIPLWAWLGEYPTISEELKTHSRYVDFSE